MILRRKHFLRILFWISLLVVLGLTLPVHAESGTCGENLTWNLTSNGVLTISGTGAMENYNSRTNRYPWPNESVVQVVIGNEVTGIGEYAFYGCSKMTGITISKSVTEIGMSAFESCTALTRVVFPDNITEIKTATFTGCKNLRSIALPKNLISIGQSAFASCANLTSVNLPEGLSSIDKYAFYSCSSLTRLRIPESTVTVGDRAFCQCTGLTEMTIPEGITSIPAELFRYCSGLRTVHLPETVTSIGKYAFEDCENLTSVNLPRNLTRLEEGAFKGCNSITSLKVPITLGDPGSSLGTNVFETAVPLYCSYGSQIFYKLKNQNYNVVYENNIVLTNADGTVNPLYTNLEQAAANSKTVGSGAQWKITLTKDIDLEQYISFGSGISDSYMIFITLDLNGHTITNAAHPDNAFVTDYVILVNSKCNLTITDSSTGRTGCVRNVIDNRFSYSAVTVYGILNVENAAIYGFPKANFSSIDMKGEEGKVNIGENACIGDETIGYGISVQGFDQVTVSGGSITGSAFGIYDRNRTGLIMDGGTVNGGVYVGRSTGLQIQGGTIYGNLTVWNCSESDKITGGCISGTVKVTGTNPRIVQGGKFGQPVDEACLVDGYGVLANTDPETSEEFPYMVAPVPEGSCGENTRWKVDEEGLLTLSGSGSVSRAGWHLYLDQITRVAVADGAQITDYAEGVFEGISDVRAGSYTETAGWLVSGGRLYITGTGMLNDVPDGSEVPWSSAADQVRLILVGDGITGLGANVFASCGSAESIVLPGSVETLSASSFAAAMKNVYAPEGSPAAQWAKEEGLFTFDPAKSPAVVQMKNELWLSTGETLDLKALFRAEAAWMLDDTTLRFEVQDDKIASVSKTEQEGDLLTALAKGDTYLTASLADQPEISVSIPLHVRKGVEKIVLPSRYVAAVGTVLELEPSEIIPADADTDLIWTVEDPAAAFIEGSTLTVMADGAVNTVVSVTSWNGVSASTSLRIYAPVIRSVKLDKIAPCYAPGDTVQLRATVRDDIKSYVNQLVSFSSSDETVASVDADGLVQFHKTGHVVLTASAGDQSDEAAVDVYVPVSDFTISDCPELFVGDEYQLSITEPKPEDAFTEMKWQSEDETVAKVDQSGKLTAVSSGQTTIRAESWNGVTKTVPVTVHDVITSIDIDPAEKNMYVLDDLQLTVRVHCGEEELINRFVRFESSDESVLKVTESGLVTSMGYGEATITATSINGLSASATIRVLREVEDFTLPEKILMTEGESRQVEITGLLPEDADPALSWSSGDESVAEVDSSGTISAKAPGSTVITAVSWNGVRRTAALEVYDASVKRIEFSASLSSIRQYETLQLSAAAYDILDRVLEDALVVFSSSDETILKVDSDGKAIGLAEGTAIITATVDNELSAQNSGTSAVDNEEGAKDSGANTEYSGVNTENRGVSAQIEITVRRVDPWILPPQVHAIEEEAFVNNPLEVIRIPSGCTSIGKRAFADCKNLYAVIFEGTAAEIAGDAFEGCDNVCLIVPEGAEQIKEYAAENGLEWCKAP